MLAYLRYGVGIPAGSLGRWEGFHRCRVRRPLPGSIRLVTRETRAVWRRIPEHSMPTWHFTGEPSGKPHIIVALPPNPLNLTSQSECAGFQRTAIITFLLDFWTLTGAVVSKCTNGSNIQNFFILFTGVFMFFVWFSQYTANIYLNIINPSAFVMKTQRNFCEVGTGSFVTHTNVRHERDNWSSNLLNRMGVYG